jgi:hypothetical protein
MILLPTLFALRIAQPAQSRSRRSSTTRGVQSNDSLIACQPHERLEPTSCAAAATNRGERRGLDAA